MQLRAVVMVSRSPAIASAPHLVAVPGEQIAAYLAQDQPYAAGQPGWQRFVEQVQRIGMFTLHRGTHPQASVDALLQLLQ